MIVSTKTEVGGAAQLWRARTHSLDALAPTPGSIVPCSPPLEVRKGKGAKPRQDNEWVGGWLQKTGAGGRDNLAGGEVTSPKRMRKHVTATSRFGPVTEQNKTKRILTTNAERRRDSKGLEWG